MGRFIYQNLGVTQSPNPKPNETQSKSSAVKREDKLGLSSNVCEAK